jgi:hypothetical protein
MMQPRFPNWQDLTPEQRCAVSNGVGPEWAPVIVRAAITSLSSRFFNEASWQRHDYGYLIGETETDRQYFDQLFFRAMVRDARALNGWRRVVALILASSFYALVRAFGWASFNYFGHGEIPVFLRPKRDSIAANKMEQN